MGGRGSGSGFTAGGVGRGTTEISVAAARGPRETATATPETREAATATPATDLDALAKSLVGFDLSDEISLAEQLEQVPVGTRLYTGQDALMARPPFRVPVYHLRTERGWKYLGDEQGFTENASRSSLSLIINELRRIRNNPRFKPRFE